MRQTIIALSGRKGSGKNTIAEFIRRWYCFSFGSHCIDFKQLVLEENTFECSFADNLKEFCIDTLGLQHTQCYGSDEEKNTPTEYRWEDVPDYYRWKFSSDRLAKELVASGCRPNRMMEVFFEDADEYALRNGLMSGRDIMQIFGTDLIRQTFGNVWAAATIRRIKKNCKPLSIVTDNRFLNEIKAVLSEPEGYIIRLTRSPFGTDDVHPSESALDHYNWNKPRHFVLDNARMTIEEQNEAIQPILKEILRRSNNESD